MSAMSDSPAAEGGGRFDFRRRLGEAFGGEDGDLRAIDRAVARWVLAHGGSMLLARVAAAASRAEGEGDSVLVLTGQDSGRFIAPLDAEALAALACEPLVASVEQSARMAGGGGSDACDAAPGWAFVLDGMQFYLRRSFAHEQVLAEMLRARRGSAGLARGECGAGLGSASEDDFAASGVAGCEDGAGSSFGGPGPTLWEAALDVESSIDALFGGDRSPAVAAQRAAVAGFVGRRLFVLTGGPGTGKTTTVLRMLLLRLRLHQQRFGVFPRLRLAAPTGKAAQRLAESLQSGAATLRERALRESGLGNRVRSAIALPASATDAKTENARAPDEVGPDAIGPYEIGPDEFAPGTNAPDTNPPDASTAGADRFDAEWAPALDHVLAAEAGTLHRLLGSRGPARGHAWHQGRRLPLDLLVIDEASMVDLALLRASFDALPEEAAVLLVGDSEQLASVGTGSVLRDLVEALQRDPRGDLVRLHHSFRAQAALQPLNAAIAAGDTEAFAQAALAAGPAFEQRSVGDARALQTALQAHATRVQAALVGAEVLDPLPANETDTAGAVTRAHAALREVQLLCALRQGPFGAQACDAAIDLAFKRQLGLPEGQAWYPGRAVIVLQNDYAAGLFNGDIGLCLRGADGALRVWFEARGSEGLGLRGLAPGALPQHGGAFALSVHKSQGSEYGEVALLLPPEPEHPILGRALLYTGATRARRGLALWATAAALHTALSRPTQRVSGLAARLLQHSL